MPGRYHTCALSTTNKIKCFGKNEYGQLGYGDNVTRGNEPNEMGDDLLEINLGSSFTPMNIMTGLYHTCALSTTNKIKCWGLNRRGELGHGDSDHRGIHPNQMGDSLLEVDLGSSFVPIQIVGCTHTCALSTTNKIKCWGPNSFGELGYGDTDHRGANPNEMGDSLLEIDLGPGFIPIQIDVGLYCTCALSITNQVKCFGGNSQGQLGYGDTNSRGKVPNEVNDTLLVIDFGSNFIPMQIATGYRHTCALSTTNRVKCWGQGNFGQLGYGDNVTRGDGPNEMGDNLREVDLGSSFIPKHIMAGAWRTCAFSTTNTLKCWGLNNVGELGYGDTNPRGDQPNQMGDNLGEIDLGSFTPAPTADPTVQTPAPSDYPTSTPTLYPTQTPTMVPTSEPTTPTIYPTRTPTIVP
eukprot:366407_1